MRKVVPLVLLSASAIAAASCSLFVSLDDLTSGAGDASDASDSSVDAKVTIEAGCPSGLPGPSMVEADGYCIDSTEVTSSQYQTFLASGVNVDAGVECLWDTTFAQVTDNPLNDCTAASVAAIGADFPVACVNWCDAKAYCTWAGKRLCGSISTGGALQHEVGAAVFADDQWYVACATAAHNPYPTGATYPAGACNTVDGGNSAIAVGSDPKCVGGYPGIYDLAGNVEEWIDSCDSSGAGGSHAIDNCHAEGDTYGATYGDVAGGCKNLDDDPRSQTSILTGFRCCSK